MTRGGGSGGGTDGGWDAIVLAGGSARRLDGVDKPAIELGGTSLLDRVLAAVDEAGTVVCAGPARTVAGREPLWCREDPPGGGPVAAVAAALPLATADAVLIVAADLPWIAPAVPVLLAALADEPSTDAALLADPDGRVNFLAGAWRRDALAEALVRTGTHAGSSVRRLVEHVRVTTVADPAGWGRDCDTWADIEAARHHHETQTITRSDR